MSDSFEFTLHSPLTQEDWNKISDAEHENTMFVTFQTPQGRQVRYIKCEVLDKIRAEIEALNPLNYVYLSSYDGHRGASDMKDDVLNIFNKYKAETE